TKRRRLPRRPRRSLLPHDQNLHQLKRPSSGWGEALDEIRTSLTNVLMTSLTLRLGREVEASEASRNGAAQTKCHPPRRYFAIRMLPSSFSYISPTCTGPK